jgi:hypothetical protein
MNNHNISKPYGKQKWLLASLCTGDEKTMAKLDNIRIKPFALVPLKEH